MTEDKNKGIASISYNILNLPEVITFDDASVLTYSYTSSGTKLKEVYTTGSLTTTREYVSGMLYINNVRQYLQTETGRVTTSSGFTYVHNISDHQGNIRASFQNNGSGVATLTQENHYYPFGLTMESFYSGTGDNHLYSAKEWKSQNNEDWYDFGWRNYDAALGRWFNVDPLGEKKKGISPYNYCLNDPINRIDPTGLDDEEDGEPGSTYNGFINLDPHGGWVNQAGIFSGGFNSISAGLTPSAMRLVWRAWYMTQAGTSADYSISSSTGVTRLNNQSMYEGDSVSFLMNEAQEGKGLSGSGNGSKKIPMSLVNFWGYNYTVGHPGGFFKIYMLDGTVMSLENSRFLFSNVAQSNGDGSGWNTAFDHAGTTVSATGFVNGGVKTVAKEYVRQVGINNKLAGIKNAKLPGSYAAAKSFGNKLGVVGGAIIVGDVLYNSEIKASHGINAFMTGIAFTGWGAPVAALWFVADVGTGLITGTSISDRIDANTGSLDWDW